jgi:type II secretory ATPase GspE/PulE/Tfp pilus assembly ATPase PilB-like protein
MALDEPKHAVDRAATDRLGATARVPPHEVLCAASHANDGRDYALGSNVIPADAVARRCHALSVCASAVRVAGAPQSCCRPTQFVHAAPVGPAFDGATALMLNLTFRRKPTPPAEAVPTVAAAAAGQPSAQRPPWTPGSGDAGVVRDASQLPAYIGVLTQRGHPLYDEGAAGQLAAVLLGDDRKTVLILRAIGTPGGMYLSLKSRVRQLDYPLLDDALAVSTGIVQQVNGVQRTEMVAAAAVAKGDDTSPLRLLWDDLLSQAVTLGTSDIHIEIRTDDKSRVRFRLGGDMVDLDSFASSLGTNATRVLQDMVGYLYTSMLADRSQSRGDYSKEADLSGQLAEMIVRDAARNKSRRISGRVQTIQMSGKRPLDGPLAGVVPSDFILRLLYVDDRTIPSLALLGYLPSQVRALNNALARRRGLTQISGRVGSGKSTTLRSLFAALPHQWKKYTLEDPPEYFHPNASMMGVQRTTGAEAWEGFGGKLLAIRRGDLDTILLGEVRDAPSMAAVRDITFSGHPVFSTLHADSGLGQVPRMTTQEMGLSREDLSDPAFLNTLLHQTLVLRLCPHCALRDTDAKNAFGAQYLSDIESRFQVDPTAFHARNPRGCGHCQPNSLEALFGFKGREVVAEWWTPDMDDRALIRAGDDIGLHRRVRAKRIAGFDEEDTLGKLAIEVGLYKALQGLLDPRSVEEKFCPFELHDVVERGGGSSSRSQVVTMPRR